jgi:hypothetical protein
MPAIIALVIAAIVALTVLGFVLHVLFSPPGCWRSSPSWPGSSSGPAAPASSLASRRAAPGSPGRLRCA